MAATLLVTSAHHGRAMDLEIQIEGPARVSDLVDALIDQASLDRLPPVPSLAVQRTGDTLLRSTPLTEVDLRSGRPAATERRFPGARSDRGHSGGGRRGR